MLAGTKYTNALRERLCIVSGDGISALFQNMVEQTVKVALQDDAVYHVPMEVVADLLLQVCHVSLVPEKNSKQE